MLRREAGTAIDASSLRSTRAGYVIETSRGSDLK
jgi:hypothetical protein